MVRSFVMLSLVLLPSVAVADGGLFRRSSVCAPVRHHAAAPVVVDQVIAAQVPFAYPQAAPIVIQNNYPPIPATISSAYAYPGGLPLGVDPFRVDPGQVLREAARLADRSHDLAGESLKVYQSIGVDALGQAGLVAQLQARAALIESTKPVVVEQQQTVAVTAGSAVSPSPQRSTAGGTICLVPVGDGTYRIVQGDAADVATAAPVSEGLSVLKARCAACHTGAGSQGGFPMFDESGNPTDLSSQAKGQILSLVRLGVMPPKTNAAGAELPVLTDEEIAAITLYLR